MLALAFGSVVAPNKICSPSPEIQSLNTLLRSSLSARAQFGVSFHQSNLPFIGLQYELLDRRLVPEVRIGVDNRLSGTSLEAVVTYAVHRREDYGVYVGLGARGPEGAFGGLLLPVGLRAYPFARQRVGFQVEAAILRLFGGAGFREETEVLRGSAGVHVRLGQI